MNTYTFVGALVIAGLYLLLRFLEMRFVLKENKPLKVIIKDMFLVYFSCVIGIFFVQQVSENSISIFGDEKKASTVVFTNSPDF